jgi:outer membrane protein assembly factor BamB
MKDLLYLGTNGYVIALDPQTGREIWSRSVSRGLIGTNSEDVCVLEHDGIVFAGCYGEVTALDARTGEILWTNGLRGAGYNDVTLCIAGKSIQYVSSRSTSHGS